MPVGRFHQLGKATPTCQWIANARNWENPALGPALPQRALTTHAMGCADAQPRDGREPPAASFSASAASSRTGVPPRFLDITVPFAARICPSSLS